MVVASRWPSRSLTLRQSLRCHVLRHLIASVYAHCQIVYGDRTHGHHWCLVHQHLCHCSHLHLNLVFLFLCLQLVGELFVFPARMGQKFDSWEMVDGVIFWRKQLFDARLLHRSQEKDQLTYVPGPTPPIVYHSESFEMHFDLSSSCLTFRSIAHRASTAVGFPLSSAHSLAPIACCPPTPPGLPHTPTSLALRALSAGQPPRRGPGRTMAVVQPARSAISAVPWPMKKGWPSSFASVPSTSRS